MAASLTGLRVLREVAQTGSFSAAAIALGYTQSGVSRQAAALERDVGTRLFHRARGGVQLTAAGRRLLAHAVIALEELDRAERELHGSPSDRAVVRLGMFISAGAVLVPRLLSTLRRTHPSVEVRTREGTTPSLARSLRAQTLDLAILTMREPYRPVDRESPPLEVTALGESQLLLAVPVTGRFGARDSVGVDELVDATWVAGASGNGDPVLGVWPGLPGRPRVGHQARDWLTKLNLVASGCGVTTVSPLLVPIVPAGVRLVSVEGGAQERRRIVVARVSAEPSPSIVALMRALRTELARLLI